MAVSKYWGDERQTDAIYAVYLKKVRYVPPQQYEGLPHYRPIDPDSHHLGADLDGLDHLQWETIRERIIKAGTLDKLVESLVNSEDQRMDSRHFNVFFATYRAFAEPEAILNKFLNWYETTAASVTSISSLNKHESSPESKSQQTLLNTIRSILICWLDMYPEDFYALNEETNFFLLNRLIDFARSRNLYDLKHKARKVRERFKIILGDGGLAGQIPSISRYSYAYTICYDPHDYGYAQHRAQMFDISRENCAQIAEQLTFWDALLFRELRPYQCQGAIWGKRNKKNANAVYSVRATIDQFNSISQRVMTSIVFPECQPEFRAKIIEKWIDIAGELRTLKNFSSLKAVLSSLQSEPVYRLKSAWSVVSKISSAQFKDLSTIFDADENGDESKTRLTLETESTTKNTSQKKSALSQNSRRTKSDVNLAETQGTLPFLGTFLTDLTMIDQAHYDYTPDGLINFEKRRREFEVLAKIRLFQSAARAYIITMDQAFCVWFYYLPSLSENECFTRSLEVEPISTSTPGARRRTLKNATNSFYSSPSTSMSKFHSLTKMFANVSTNDTGTASTPLGNLPSQNFHLNNLQQYLHCQQTPTLSFYGQRSNDSGIHTEDFNATNNNELGTGLFKSCLKSSSLQNSSRNSNEKNNNLLHNTSENLRSSTAPNTPAGTINSRGKNAAILDNYNDSEFVSSQMHFSNSISRKSINDNCFVDFCDSSSLASTSQKIGLQSSTPVKTSFNNNQASVSSNKIKFSNSSSSLNGVSGANTGTRSCNKSSGHSHQKSNSSSSSCSSYGSMPSPLTVSGSADSSFISNRISSSKNNLPPHPPTKDFHLARVGLDDSIQNEQTDVANINYKCIKVVNGDKMSILVERALEKHMIDLNKAENYYLVQLLPDGSELKLPINCNPFYAVAPDPTSPMLNFLLKKHDPNLSFNSDNITIDDSFTIIDSFLAPSAKKLNRQKRTNLLRWSSGYL